MKRREFLFSMQSAMLLGLSGSIPGLTLLSANAAADSSAPKRFFVLIRMQTGWDVTLGLDPQVHAPGNDQNDMFIEYRPEDIIQAGNIRLAPAAAALAPFAKNLAIVNGIYQSENDQSHGGNLDYISTGDSMGKSADLSVEVANATQSGPYGVVFNSSVKRANRTVMLSNTGSLEAMAQSFDISSVAFALKHLSATTEFGKSRQVLQGSNPNRTRLIDAIAKIKPKLDELQQSNNSDNNQTTDTANIHAGIVMAAAFASRSSYQAQLEIQNNLDTHSAHPGNHLKAQKTGWEAVAKVMQVFKDTPYLAENGQALGSLFDNTTFMVVSEFSRTPALNSAKGKDHNPINNSVLLAGAGVVGNQVVGKSNLVPRRLTSNGESRHSGGPIDYSNGKVPQSKVEAEQSNFQFIYPENVAATVAAIQKVDRSRFASVTADVLPLPGIVDPS